MSWWRASGFAALVCGLVFGLGGRAEAGDLHTDDPHSGDPYSGDPYSGGDASPSRRLIAIGDIHGAYNGFRSILREVSLIDGKDRWIGGDAIFVQTGDFLDRGPGATTVAKLLMDLQEEAPRHGGKVIVLLGNHEILNLIGDLRDVTKYILRNHVDDRSEKRLTVSCNTFARFHRKLAQRGRRRPPQRRALLDKCYAEQHLGLVEYLREIGPEGELGGWLRQLPATVQIGDVVFVHGGISPELAGRDLEKLNREVRQEIRCFDRARRYLIKEDLVLPTSGLAEVVTRARMMAAAGSGSGGFPIPPEILRLARIEDWLLIRDDGPFWFRGYARWTEEEGQAEMSAILEPLGAEHIVVAHTPQQKFTINQRFSSQVFLIDTGMLAEVYKGRPSALEIRGGRFTAFYVMQKSVLYEPQVLASLNGD